MRIIGALALSILSACASRATAPEPIRTGYLFKRGDVLRFQVESRLAVDMSGTHPLFLVAGNTNPLTWKVAGEFENVVLDIESDGWALLERRVREIKSAGEWNGVPFGLTWSCERDKTVPEFDEMKSDMNQYVAQWILSPLRGRVDDRGNSLMATPEHRRLVMRQGMMYWPIHVDQPRWITSEEIAVPILHHKLRVTFRSSVVEDSGGILRIAAVALLSPANEGTVVNAKDPTFAVSGGAKAEFDFASGRLKSLEVDLQIRFAGKATLLGGGEGDLQGVVTYREVQRLVQ